MLGISVQFKDTAFEPLMTCRLFSKRVQTEFSPRNPLESSMVLYALCYALLPALSTQAVLSLALPLCPPKM